MPPELEGPVKGSSAARHICARPRIEKQMVRFTSEINAMIHSLPQKDFDIPRFHWLFEHVIDGSPDHGHLHQDLCPVLEFPQPSEAFKFLGDNDRIARV